MHPHEVRAGASDLAVELAGPQHGHGRRAGSGNHRRRVWQLVDRRRRRARHVSQPGRSGLDEPRLATGVDRLEGEARHYHEPDGACAQPRAVARRGQPPRLQDGVVCDVQLAVPAARERKARPRQVVRLPVVRGRNHLDPVGRAPSGRGGSRRPVARTTTATRRSRPARRSSHHTGARSRRAPPPQPRSRASGAGSRPARRPRAPAGTRTPRPGRGCARSAKGRRRRRSSPTPRRRRCSRAASLPGPGTQPPHRALSRRARPRTATFRTGTPARASAARP